MMGDAFLAALETDDAQTPARLAEVLEPLVRAELGPQAPKATDIARILAPSVPLLRRFQVQEAETQLELLAVEVMAELLGDLKGLPDLTVRLSSPEEDPGRTISGRDDGLARTIAACWTDSAGVEVAKATVFVQLEYLTAYGDRTYRAEAALRNEPIFPLPRQIEDEALLKAYREWLCLVASKAGTPRGFPLRVWRLLSGNPRTRGLGRAPRLSGGSWPDDYSYLARFPTRVAEQELRLWRTFIRVMCAPTRSSCRPLFSPTPSLSAKGSGCPCSPGRTL